MKRFSVIAIATLCTLLLNGCADNQNYGEVQNDFPLGISKDISDTSEIPCDRHPEMGGTDANEVFDVTVSRVNWTEGGEIYSCALNTGEMYISSVQHLPIYKFNTLEELENFKTRFGDTLSLGSDYDDISSFNGATAKYDDAFFADNTLMLTYITSGSGSNRFGVNSIFCDGSSFVIHVEQTNFPEVGTCDMAAWLITVAVPDSMVENCTMFDADFNNFE